jgi:hypothetical protein
MEWFGTAMAIPCAGFKGQSCQTSSVLVQFAAAKAPLVSFLDR